MYNLLNETEEAPKEPNTVQPPVERNVMKQQVVKPTKGKKPFPLWAKRAIGYTLITLSILLFIGYFLVYMPATKAYAQAQVVADHMRVLAAYGRDQNILGVQQELPKAQEAMKQLRKEASPLAWTGFIPFLGAYYHDFDHGMNAGDAGLNAASKMVNVIAPYADLLGLKGKGTYSGSAQDRIAQLVMTMDKILPELDAVIPDLTKVRDEMNQINPKRYSFSPKIQTALEKAIGQANDAEKLLTDAKPFLSVLPQFLGRDVPTRYLVEFLNDKELRPTGGFVTAFARLTVDKGRVINSDSYDIYSIDQQLRLKLTPPEAIQKYLPEPNGKTKTHWQIRDSNFYPDFKQSAVLFENIYEYYKSKEYVSLTEDQLKQRQSQDWDGLVSVDTQVVQAILDVLGPVQAEGITFTSETDKRCNCPQVVYELETYAERALNGNAERKALIGSLMQEILLQTFKQQDKIPVLANTAVRLMNEKHVQVYMHDEKLQKTMENMDWAGRVASNDNPTRLNYSDTDWDYWNWNEANFAGRKANLYVKQTSEHNYEIGGDGTIIKTVTVTVENPQRNDYWLNAPYRAYFRAYVPVGSELISSNGSRDPVNVFRQYNKTVFDGFYILQPQQNPPVKITLKYRLPFKAKKGSDFKALIQKQPGTGAFHYILNGLGDKQEFDLNEDKKIQVKL